MIIEAKNLQYTYSQKTQFKTFALNGVDITIPENEFFGIIGHTGSGKSTFIKHINALLRGTSGDLKVGEFDLSNKNKKIDLKSLRKRVGMVFQYPEYQLFAESVFLDVAFGIKNFYKEWTDEQVANAVKDAITKVGLNYDEVKDKSPFELSGGQKRRVAIAGVIAVSPEVLILDEPCAGLDPKGKKELWSLLHSLNSSSAKTVIIVSHDMDDVAENCTKCAVIDNGKILATGSPKDVFLSCDLQKCGLDKPLTLYLYEGLKEKGINLDLKGVTTKDFIDSVLAYKNK